MLYILGPTTGRVIKYFISRIEDFRWAKGEGWTLTDRTCHL